MKILTLLFLVSLYSCSTFRIPTSNTTKCAVDGYIDTGIVKSNHYTSSSRHTKFRTSGDYVQCERPTDKHDICYIRKIREAATKIYNHNLKNQSRKETTNFFYTLVVTAPIGGGLDLLWYLETKNLDEETQKIIKQAVEDCKPRSKK